VFFVSSSRWCRKGCTRRRIDEARRDKHRNIPRAMTIIYSCTSCIRYWVVVQTNNQTIKRKERDDMCRYASRDVTQSNKLRYNVMNCRNTLLGLGLLPIPAMPHGANPTTASPTLILPISASDTLATIMPSHLLCSPKCSLGRYYSNQLQRSPN
jgi:hypothetical protein